MTISKTFFKTTALVAVALLLIGCDHDQETIGSEIIGEPGFQAQLYEDAQISVSNVDLEGVQTNNLTMPGGQSLHLLGVKNDQVFGEQKAHILTQLRLSNTSPSFAEGARLDSVVLSIPYFHTEEEPDEDGQVGYKLDSIYGKGAIGLEIYESRYYLNAYDPDNNFETPLPYFSDIKDQVENNLGTLLYQTSDFRPSASAVTNYEDEGSGTLDTVQLPPQLRVHLPVDFFQSKILDQEGSVHLSNHNNFQNYLRGLYIKTEASGNEDLMMHLNLANSNAGVTLYYSTEGETEDDEEEAPRIKNSFKLSFASTRMNIFEQDPVLPIPGSVLLQGGQGSVAVVELFSGTDSDGDGVSDELEDLRDNQWLINEANLIFKVNREAMAGIEEPSRVYLYNLDRGELLADYAFESESPQNSMNSEVNRGHLVPLKRDDQGRGIEYKIRITQHVNNILNRDADNVRLGLVVSHNVNIINNSEAKTAEDQNVERVPVSSVLSPLGTVLYGMDASDPEKRPKLRIYYTEPKN